MSNTCHLHIKAIEIVFLSTKQKNKNKKTKQNKTLSAILPLLVPHCPTVTLSSSLVCPYVSVAPHIQNAKEGKTWMQVRDPEVGVVGI